MVRLFAVVALAVAGALTGVIVASYGSSGESTAASSTPLVAPAIPCSSSAKQKQQQPTTTSAIASTNQSASKATSWTGVFERVTAHTESDGSVKKARQFTRVTTEGSGPVTVNVPMSDKHLRKRDRGKKPSFSNGMAQIDLNPSGTKTRQFDSDFAGKLPLAVKVSVTLNGKPISVHDVKHKSGTVEVKYELDNTTAKPVTVCFKGFNGSKTKQTVSTPSPLIANLSFTVPSNASTFHAPGASLAPAKKGVSASWLTELFPPLGKTTQTFTLTMETSKAEIPEAHVLVETLDPLSPSGALPQKSSVAVGQAAAAADKATAKVQSDIAALQTHSSQPKQKSGRSRKSGKSSGSRKSRPKPALSFGTPTSALTTMQSQITRLGDENLAFIANVNKPTRSLFGSTRTSIGGLAGSTRRSIDGSTTKLHLALRELDTSINRSLSRYTGRMRKAAAALKADLARAISTPSLLTIAASAARLQITTSEIKGRADAVAGEVAPLALQVDQLVAGLQGPVGGSADLVQRLIQVKADLDGLAGADKTDPTFLKLVADVTEAQHVAGNLNSQLNDFQQKAQAVANEVHTLQTDVLSLQNEVTGLQAAAIANAEGTVQGQFAAAAAGLDGRIAQAEASATRTVETDELKAAQAVNVDEKKAERSVTAAGTDAKKTVNSAESQAQRQLTVAMSRARRSVLETERSVSETLTSVQEKANRALASAKQKAKQGGQASLAAAQAAAAQAEAAVGDAVDTANHDYARLLTTNEVAVENQLPGGDAKGVTEQNGSFRYVIKGS